MGEDKDEVVLVVGDSIVKETGQIAEGLGVMLGVRRENVVVNSVSGGYLGGVGKCVRIEMERAKAQGKKVGKVIVHAGTNNIGNKKSGPGGYYDDLNKMAEDVERVVGGAGLFFSQVLPRTDRTTGGGLLGTIRKLNEGGEKKLKRRKWGILGNKDIWTESNEWDRCIFYDRIHLDHDGITKLVVGWGQDLRAKLERA